MKSASLLAILLSCALSVSAQNELKPVLNSSDIDRFIKTYEPMASEFELLSDEIEEDEDDWENMTYATVLKSFESGLDNNKAVDILEKYGWEKSTYGKKIMAIAMGTSYLMVLNRIDEMPEEQAKAMTEIYTTQYNILVHEDDLKLLKPRISELQEIFSEE